MSEGGFETTEINGEPIYHSGEKYVRIICNVRMSTLELAVGLHDAKKISKRLSRKREKITKGTRFCAFFFSLAEASNAL